MLNCCIRKKKEREEEQKRSTSSSMASAHPSSSETDGPSSEMKDDDNEDDDDDEFFECVSESEEAEKSDTCQPDSASADDIMQHKADGRLRQLGEEKLLHVDEALYIPLTQEPAPMTEDQLAEHAEVLTRYVIAIPIMVLASLYCLKLKIGWLSFSHPKIAQDEKSLRILKISSRTFRK